MNRFNKKYLIFFTGLFLTINVVNSAPIVGQGAPDFVLPSLADGNLRLSEYRSEVVVLTFWASWCARCNQALPLYKSLFNQYKNSGLQILTVAIEGDVDISEQLADGFNLEFPILLDSNYQVSRLYDLGKMPMTVVIDREGVVVFIDSGFRGDSVKRIAAEVSGLMEE